MAASPILALGSPLATLELAGGKGANLSRLWRGGFPVPDGFVIATPAYAAFSAANGLLARIEGTLARLDPTDPRALEDASDEIRGKFARALVPPELAAEIRAAYAERFGAAGAVAVRSSATAEDLPDLSFAGQQDTYLNVVGADALMAAVVNCWSSLWTARAIGYRARNGIAQDAVSLAVVVQAMVQAEAAGVLFTANPLTGRRAESVIDATLGLGEALVSGQVEPDHYVVDTATHTITEKRLGSKGSRPENRSIQALPDHAILELAALGAQVQSSFGAPQDIEWTWANERLALVQSRPITSLFPLPDGMSPDAELRVLASFGAFQGVLAPFTPLGQDALRSVSAVVARNLGYSLTWETQPVLRLAGERLFIDVTGALRNGFGRRLLRGALSQVEPGIGEAILSLWDDPRLAPRSSRLSLGAARRVAPLLLPVAARFLMTLLRPDAARQRAQQGVELGVAHFAARAQQCQTLGARLALLDDIANVLRRFLLGYLLPGLAPGLVALGQLYGLTDELPGGRELALEITRGLPHNVTTEMDLALWRIAQRIQADPAALQAMQARESRDLAAAYLAGSLPPVAQSAFGDFLARYGMRGLGEIDLGRPRWREDPAPVMAAAQSYLSIADAARAPDVMFARGAASAEAAIARLESALRATRQGRIKAARARWAARRVRSLAGLRETPKFTIVRMLGLTREALLESGRDLTAAGWLLRPEDIFFLPRAHLQRLAGLPPEGVDLALKAETIALVSERRLRDEREARRRQTPRVMLSDGRAFYEGMGQRGAADSPGLLKGAPVSPGVAEGRVNVVLNPSSARMEPGDILVCPGTDPSWTPLFLAAGGLVMEVGGVMTHGSVVAREYGIPAVVGVTEATTRLRSGQRVRVDGSRGVVELLEDGAADLPDRGLA